MPSPTKTKAKLKITTKDKILKAAEKVFASKGFSGAAISDIAKAAKINQSLIYHHFTNKEDLWREVKYTILLRYDETDILSVQPRRDLKGFLRDVITNYINFFTKNPHILRVRYWQRLEPQSKQIDLMIKNSTYRKMWKSALCDLQKRGEINPKLKIDQAMLLIYAVIFSFFDANVYLHTDDDKAKKAYVDFAVESLFKAFKK